MVRCSKLLFCEFQNLSVVKCATLKMLDYSLIFVATDRISAFDVILPTGMPKKGVVLP